MSRRTMTRRGLAFYRKYTEQFLRRYMWTSLQMGRSPSVLGNLVYSRQGQSHGAAQLSKMQLFSFMM